MDVHGGKVEGNVRKMVNSRYRHTALLGRARHFHFRHHGTMGVLPEGKHGMRMAFG